MTLTQNVLLNPSTLNNMQILTVDSDRDSGALYRAVLEEYGVEVTTTESIKETLDCFHQFIPDILICEARCLGESVHPLLYQVRAIAKITIN
jgi:DNA-binding response OmpR family regulator